MATVDVSVQLGAAGPDPFRGWVADTMSMLSVAADLMRRQSLRSTTIQSAGHDPRTDTLELEFVNTGTYRYAGVPRSVFEQLLAAPSKGAFFNMHIRDSYPHQKM